MKDYKVKLKRQCEILGMVLYQPDYHKISDFEDAFGVNSLTIKRDLQFLRSLGIGIHSNKGRGIRIESAVDNELIKNILMQYIGISVNQSSYNKAINLLVSKSGNSSLSNVVLLQMSIDKKRKIKFVYDKPEGNILKERIVEPYSIFQSENNWRLLANQDGMVKQFLISKIKSIKVLEEKFKSIEQNEIDGIFKTSFKSWLGNERFPITLKIFPPWTERIKPLRLMESQEIIENPDGSIIYKTVVNSLSEIASWIVTRGKGIIVLEPEELRKRVIYLAEDVLVNYR